MTFTQNNSSGKKCLLDQVYDRENIYKLATVPPWKPDDYMRDICFLTITQGKYVTNTHAERGPRRYRATQQARTITKKKNCQLPFFIPILWMGRMNTTQLIDCRLWNERFFQSIGKFGEKVEPNRKMCGPSLPTVSCFPPSNEKKHHLMWITIFTNSFHS